MIGQPYKVGGRWYHPEMDEDYDKTGLASWYGPKFHGKRTANGERFDQTELTAAHPTLPLPSYVRVTVVKTGTSAVVRVNDRGPFHRGRIIDVSKAAADKLGFRAKGSAKVRVEYLGPAPIGGGDQETLAAEAKYGKSAPSTGRGFFGFGKSDDDAEKVEVRLAAATDAPVTQPRDGRMARNGTLPGVRLQEPAMRQEPNASAMTPSSASAYGEQGDNAAVDAATAMGDEAVVAKAQEAPKAHPMEVKPLEQGAEEASQERVMGAHDMFASLGMSPLPPVGASAEAAAGQ
ncbi:septal ring lytic transglycosylase RlpA family protein [Acuticoccus kandeliae]|uniref:septal ring lytic transglycosylase RlpA family protein n=1 Tax=Acuticoccus kandeliae TaxID=2073160 RepID=UPI000D3E03A8